MANSGYYREMRTAGARIGPVEEVQREAEARRVPGSLDVVTLLRDCACQVSAIFELVPGGARRRRPLELQTLDAAFVCSAGVAGTVV